MANCKKGSLLQFVPFQSAADKSFWHTLSSLKLNKLGIDESPIPIAGFYAPCSHHQVSNPTLLAESLPSESNEPYCPIPSGAISESEETGEKFQLD